MLVTNVYEGKNTLGFSAWLLKTKINIEELIFDGDEDYLIESMIL